jgi:DNA processing protein
MSHDLETSARRADTPSAGLPAWLALARVPALTAPVLRVALEAAGDVHALLDAPHAFLPARLAPRVAAAARDDAALDAELAWLDGGADRALIACADAAYPPLLAAAPDAPVALWVHGDARVLAAPQIAVVGSRRPTPTGRQIARDWSARFAARGAVVTSGLAAGIDAAAHGGALDVADGRTVAVCGTGLDRAYPEQHAELAARIATRGAVVSEFPPGTPARPANFPRRNRIISGLAVVTLVVEAASRSGSLITARLAGEQGREVCAVPGSVLNPLAAGCHALLKQGARLVESADEVLSALEFSSLLAPRDAPAEAGREAAATPDSRARVLDKEYEMLLDALGFEPLDVDTLVDRTGLAAQIVSSMLLILELQGRVEPRAGRFCRSSIAEPSSGPRPSARAAATRYDPGT